MAIVVVTTSPATLDSGSSEFVTVTNTGTVDVTVARGSQSFVLRPTQGRTVYPEGASVTASVVSGSGQVTTAAQAAQVTQAQQVAANTAAIAGLPGTYERRMSFPLGDPSAQAATIPTFTRQGRLFTQAQSGLNSLYSPWVIRVDDKIGSPLGKFYLYYSTNHDGGQGGIGLAYANDPAGPWTVYGSNPIFQDLTANYQTENPAVLWDELNSRFLCYYKADSSFHSYVATSTDGRTWTRVSQAVPKPSFMYGNGTTGYMRPFRTGGTYRAYHLIGGGNLCGMAISHSYDGLTWRTDARPLAYDIDQTGSNTRRIDWHSCVPFLFRGQLWILGTLSDFTSGGVTGNPTQFVGLLSQDMRSLASAPITVASTLLNGETTPDSFGNVIEYNGALYTYYASDNGVSGVGGGYMAYAKGGL